jgi:hypothetical protein
MGWTDRPHPTYASVPRKKIWDTIGTSVFLLSVAANIMCEVWKKCNNPSKEQTASVPCEARLQNHTGLPSPQARDDHYGRPEYSVVPKGKCPNHEALMLRPYTESFSQSKVESKTGISGWLHAQRVIPAPKFKRRPSCEE